jgi:hypothetical protein
MLALYDSQDYQLRKSKNLNRTRVNDSLYVALLNESAGRKKASMTSSPQRERKHLITEMQRLGVAALGMYNRRKVYILSSELDDDSYIFRHGEKCLMYRVAQHLIKAELFIGKFFLYS